MSLFGNKIKPTQEHNQLATVAFSGERIEEIDPELIDLENRCVARITLASRSNH